MGLVVVALVEMEVALGLMVVIPVEMEVALGLVVVIPEEKEVALGLVVVSPVEMLPSGVVTPKVPILAARSPHMRQIWRVISAVEVLPLVPVTATITSGDGVKKRAAIRAKVRRGCSLVIWTAPSTATPGKDTTARAPAS